jgi:two-component system nitrogen regulation response regulator GlnG
MARLLLIDDEEDVRYSFGRIFASPDTEVRTAASGEEGLQVAREYQPDLVVLDNRMGAGMNGLETLRHIREEHPRMLVIMLTAYGSTQTAIEAMKAGAYDYVLKPFDVPRMKDLVALALKAARDMKQPVLLDTQQDSGALEQELMGRHDSMVQVFKMVGQLAASDATVLITGESGTGKELVARAIYHHSKRNQQLFLAVNCAAIPEQLLESELFGHERGAFTGATIQRIGKFEQCHRGTLFLDEIGDMTPATQTKILRVLQSGSFERVGGNQQIKTDVRIIAATNKPLEQAVAAGAFREDLFYRLNVVRIRTPALRERTADIPLLVDHLLKRIAREQGLPARSISAPALRLLEKYHWPGNVRELENVLRRAFVVAKGPVLLPGDLPAEVTGDRPAEDAIGSGSGATAGGDVASLARSLFQWARREPRNKIIPAVERELVICALTETGGNQMQAARLLGITRATLRKRIEKFGISREIKVQ